MTVDNDNVSVAITSITVEAYLSGSWAGITGDVLQSAGISWGGGIRGVTAVDLVATSTPLTFVLDNSSGKYYPDGPSALTGWGEGVPVRLSIVYNSETAMQYYGRTRLAFSPGIHPNEARCNVTVYDWLELANTQPIVGPSTLTNVTYDVAAQDIIDLAPIKPLATSLEVGDSVFPTAFDDVGDRTRAYTELSKLVQSEFGRMYLVRDRINGEKLVIENASHRGASHPVASVPAGGYLLRADGGKVLRADGGRILLSGWDTLGKISDGYRIRDIGYGRNIANYFTVRGYPRDVSQDPQVLVSSGEAIAVPAGGTVTVKLPYTDPNGGGTRINAITDSMIQPNPTGTQDTQLRTLLRMANATDATGYNTWTTGGSPGPSFTYGLALDGYNVPIVSGGKFGAYGLFDGVDWYMYSTSDDYNFGTGDFTISWWEHRLNINTNNDSVDRDYSAAYSPFRLGVADGTTMKAYFSSNGSSWDIGDGRDMGPVKVREWTHYKICRRDGMFYIFVDSKLTDSWYSAASIKTTSNPLAIARSYNGYCYTAIDDFYVIKGRAENTTDFDLPRIQKSINLDEDYWGNTAQDRTGTDITSDITVTATYGTEAATFVIENDNASAGFVYVQARGLGIFRYSPDERIAQDLSLIHI